MAEQARKQTRVYPVRDLVAAGIEVEALMRVIEKQSDADIDVEALADLLQQLRRSDTVKPLE